MKRLRLVDLLPRLSEPRPSILIPLLGLVAAFLVRAAEGVWSTAAVVHATRQKPEEVCGDLVDTGVPSGEIVVSTDVPRSYTCEGLLADGSTAMQEHIVGTSVLPVVAVIIAAVSTIALIAVASALMVKRVGARRAGGSSNAGVPYVGGFASAVAGWCAGWFAVKRQTWAVRLLVVACVLTPLTVLTQFLQSRAASKTDGSPVCPSTVQGEEVLGYSLGPRYLPPRLVCSGDTVSGLEFTTVSYGLPFYGFLFGAACFAVSMGLLVAARAWVGRSMNLRHSDGHEGVSTSSPAR